MCVHTNKWGIASDHTAKQQALTQRVLNKYPQREDLGTLEVPTTETTLCIQEFTLDRLGRAQLIAPVYGEVRRNNSKISHTATNDK